MLDESIQLYRQHWVTYALVSAIALVPPALLTLSFMAAGAFLPPISAADLQNGRLLQTAAIYEYAGAAMGLAIVSMLFSLAWSAAIVATTDSYMRGDEPKWSRVYRRALRSYLAVLLAAVFLVIALVPLSAIAGVLFVISLFGVAGSVIALVALLVFWLRPGARKGWVKWLIILAAPYGLPAYFLGLWSMFVPAAVLERQGPLRALRRSRELVTGHWFRVVSILTIAGVIVAILQFGIASLVRFFLALSISSRGQLGLDSAETIIANAVAIVLQILFASVGTIVYTLLFVDLRNRREGADIIERLSQLEAEPVAANG